MNPKNEQSSPAQAEIDRLQQHLRDGVINAPFYWARLYEIEQQRVG